MVYTCTTPNGVWCKTNAFFLGKEGLAGTRDRGILWEKRDSQGLAGTGTRVTLAITQAGCGVRRTGTGTRDAFFLGEEGTPRAPRSWHSMGKPGTQVDLEERLLGIVQSPTGRAIAGNRKQQTWFCCA